MERFGLRYTFGLYTLDPGTRRLLRGRVLVPVNGKALELLLLLVRNRGAALSREEI